LSYKVIGIWITQRKERKKKKKSKCSEVQF